jgi:hypothetical protein
MTGGKFILKPHDDIENLKETEIFDIKDLRPQ